MPLPDRIVIHGSLTADGQKIGKSLGNAIDPFECIARYGCDAVRYYLLRGVPSLDDGDFSERRLGELYNADLANGLGNLVSRLATLCERSGYGCYAGGQPPLPAEPECRRALEACELDKAAAALWQTVGDLNRQIEVQRPWELLPAAGDARREAGGGGQAARLHDLLTQWLARLRAFTHWLQPLLPGTAERIRRQLFDGAIRAAKPLFPRLDPFVARPPGNPH